MSSTTQTTRTSDADNNTAAKATNAVDEHLEERPAAQQPTPEPEEPEAEAQPEEPEVQQIEGVETTEAAPDTDEAAAADDDTTDDTADDTAEPGPVPGRGGFELLAPVIAAGIAWTPTDAEGSPIGAALAAEIAGVA